MWHLLAIGLWWAACGTAHAGPPYQTDDPEPAPTNHYEINIAVQQTQTASGRSGTAPLVEFNYGAIPDAQLHMALPLAFNHADGSTTQRGIGDAELGVKYRLLQETDLTPMVAIYPTVFFPTGNADRGLGNGSKQILLPFWLQKTWGRWTADAGAGYWVNHAAGQRNNWFTGLLVQRAVSEHLSLGMELFHRGEQSVDAGSSSGFNVGATLNLSTRNHILLSVGRGLQNGSATNRLSTYLAYQLTE